MVAKLDRLSRSVIDAAQTIERARREGWNLVALDLGVDFSTAAGEAMAHMTAVFAQLERRLIGERTRAALAVRKAQGVRLGRPPALTEQLRRRIRRLRRIERWRTGAGRSRARDQVGSYHKAGERLRVRVAGNRFRSSDTGSRALPGTARLRRARNEHRSRLAQGWIRQDRHRALLRPLHRAMDTDRSRWFLGSIYLIPMQTATQ